MQKKVTKSNLEKNVETLIQSVGFITKHMVTKNDVRDIVREEVENIIEKKDLATKDDLKGIVSSAHNRIDQELQKRNQLEIRVGHIEKHLNIKPPVGTTSH